MYLHFLLLRIKQGERFLLEIGTVRLIIVFGFLIYLSIGFWDVLKNSSAANLSVFLVLSTLATVHFQRADQGFLVHFPIKPQILFVLEYLAIGLVFIATLSLKWYWLQALTLLLGIGVIAHIPIKKQVLNIKIIPLPFIMTPAFEWKSGVRKSFLPLLLLYIVALSLLKTPFAMPLGVITLGLIVSGFYMESEPILMLETVGHAPKKILFHKVKIAAIHFLIFTAPFLALSLIFYAEWWFLSLYTFIAGLFIISFAIVMKYALYEPNQPLQLNGFLVGFVTFSLVVPFLAPVPFVMLFVYGRKAIVNLKNYL